MDQQPMAGTSGCGDSIDMQRVNLEGNMFMEQWNEYLEVLASKAPTPGGGSAAAVYGAIGTALGEMVGNLTAGKKKFAIYEEDVQRILVRLGEREWILSGWKKRMSRHSGHCRRSTA